MLLVDRMLVGGIKFVLGKLAAAVDAELNDDGSLREQLLQAQMQYELGELSDDEFKQVEAALLARMREIREARGGNAPLSPLDGKLSGVEATFASDADTVLHENAPAPESPAPAPESPARKSRR